MTRPRIVCKQSTKDASPGEKRLGSEANSTLRARLRRITEHKRERQCGVCKCREAGPGIVASGRPGRWSTRWIGVLTCSHIWTCPVCSVRIRAERCGRVQAALSAAGGRWQMVTFTIRHEGYMPLRRTMKGLAKAWRRVRQGGSVQDTWTARVTGSVRAFEVTHSRRNGWHPHVHVLLRTSEWSDDERADLLVRWRAAVEREIGAECVPSFERAVAWSEPIDLCRGDALGETEHRRTRYLFKLGLEVAGSGKRGRRGSRTPWQIAEDATRGDSESVDLWREYASATRGHRMISLDARAQRFAKTPMAAVLDVNIAQPWEDEHESERVTIAVDELELQAFRHYERTTDPAILAVVLADIASAERPETTARAWIDIVCRKLSYSLRHGRSPPPLDSS